MNEDYYRKANLINCNPLYHSKLKFMTLKQIKELHSNNGVNSDDLRLKQDTMISSLELLEKNT